MSEQIIRDAEEHFGEAVRSIRVQYGIERHAFNARTGEVRYAFSPNDFGLVDTTTTFPDTYYHAADIPSIDDDTEEEITPAATFEDVDTDEEETRRSRAKHRLQAWRKGLTRRRTSPTRKSPNWTTSLRILKMKTASCTMMTSIISGSMPHATGGRTAPPAVADHCSLAHASALAGLAHHRLPEYFDHMAGLPTGRMLNLLPT